MQPENTNPPLPKPHAVFFDWDGTLSDSFHFIFNAHRHARAELGLEDLDIEKFRPYFGRPREVVYTGLYGAEFMDQARDLFTAYVKENHTKELEPLDHAQEVLELLQKLGIPAGVVSNKLGKVIRMEAAHLGWDKYLCTIIGSGDAPADKPTAESLKKAIEISKLEHISMNDIWYVGDTESDQGCAMNAGCKFVFIGDDKEIMASPYEYKPHLKFKNCQQLLDYLLQYV